MNVTSGSTTTSINYYYRGGNLIDALWGSNRIHIFYDAGGSPISIKYNGTQYYYVKNLQGDIVAITNSSGSEVVSYAYDAWGKVLSVTGTQASTVGAANPLRYRGYFYDTETGLYYLGSRYYDPGVGRFVNADDATLIGAGGEFYSFNLFTYCRNNPIRFQDPLGHIAISTIILVGSIVIGIAAAVYTGYEMRKAGFDWETTIQYSASAGCAAFMAIYTLGAAAYDFYCNFCYYNGYTPVTDISFHSEEQSIPQEAYDTYDYVISHNGTPPNGYKGGRVYENDGRGGTALLPTSTGPYKEYDIAPKIQGMPRGPERIVIGAGRTAWYTADHYKSFIRMNR